MRILVASLPVALLCILAPCSRADPTATRPAVAPVPTGLVPVLRHLELDFPVLRPLRSSFSQLPSPGCELLGLPTFRAQAVWWERARLSLVSTSQVMPALEAECSMVCQPLLERSFFLEGRLHLGSMALVPEAHLFAGLGHVSLLPSPSTSQGRGSRSHTLLRWGVAGALDL